VEKQRFLFIYDYGTGGVWGLVAAENATQVVATYPELTLVSERPAWMDDVLFAQIESTMSFDVSAPSGWLLELKRT
jgi:hypothetical protein